MARITPTPGQMAAAFGACRLPGWPAELEAALADPVRAAVVRLHAVRLALGHDDLAGHRTVHRPVVQAPDPPQDADTAGLPVQPARPQRTRRQPLRAAPLPQLPLVDRKRAAAGDGDD